MKSKKLTSLILLCALTLSFASCAGGNSDKPSQTVAVNTTSADVSDTVETTTAELQPDLPDYDFQGGTFTFMVRGPSYNEWESQDISVDEQNGEPVNDAVYVRNVYLEDKYNVKIAKYGATSVGADAKKAINAGDSTYDVVMADTGESSSLAAQGFVNNLYDVPYLDLSAEWWDQRSVSQLSIGHILYFCTGDLSIMANDATWILMFNKKIAESFNLDDIYQRVYDGKWTFDAMYDMMTLVSTDVNGDGVMSPLDDQLGFATHDSSLEGLFFASGSHTFAKDSDDMPYIDMNNERMIGIIEKANKIIADPNVGFNLSSNKFGLSSALEDLQPVFENGHSLFYGEVMQCIIRLRTMEVDFGVIPFPKYDENQEQYNHFIHTTACMVTVPKTNLDLERTGIMLEAMAAKSKYTLQKAYYDVCLDGKFMRDEESAGMLDIILDTRNYDIGYIYGWGGLFSSFLSCVKKGNTDFASEFAKKETSAKTAMEKTLETWLA